MRARFEGRGSVDPGARRVGERHLRLPPQSGRLDGSSPVGDERVRSPASEEERDRLGRLGNEPLVATFVLASGGSMAFAARRRGPRAAARALRLGLLRQEEGLLRLVLFVGQRPAVVKRR